MGCCGWGGAGAAAGAAGDDADSTEAGWGGGGGGTKAGGAELTGAAGAGIEVSWVRGASAGLVEFFGPALLPEGAAAGGGGAIVEAGLGVMMELRCREDLVESDFLVGGW